MRGFTLALRVLAATLFPILEQSHVSTSGTREAEKVLEVTSERLVATDPQDRPMVEPHLAVDPNNLNHWLAAVIVIRPDMSGSDCASLVSFDAGKTWARRDFGHAECGDPWVGFLPNGTALLAVLATKTSKEEQQLLVYRSIDGGRVWAEPVSLGMGHDHETFAVPQKGSQKEDAVFVTSAQSALDKASSKVLDSIFVASSGDGGKTFPSSTNYFFSQLPKNAMNPALLPDGTLLIAFSEFGRTDLDGFVRLGREHNWLLKSRDGGKSFLPPTLTNESCGKTWDWLAFDNSMGPFRGRLYWLCTNSSYEDVLLQYSPDGGERWSKPIPANRRSGNNPYTRTPMMAVSQEGAVGVAWYDGRINKQSFRGPFRCQEVYFTASLDGGETFLPEARVSSEASCPVSQKNGDVGFRFPAGGDYMGLAAGEKGEFHLLWSDSRSGIYQLWTATVRVSDKPRP
ncbi:MAG TPA: sialidase family protein [Candidatus Angelobacter sp.]|nr:sialidase family protein [Candidatus Angelobacter sp.]